MSDKAIVHKLFAVIGDKTVDAQIRNQEEAKGRSDGAVSGGHSAVFAG
jgi:hypothetical protein